VVEEGKRRYLVRTDNELTSVERINDVVLRTDVDGASGRIARVKVSDVAVVSFDYSRLDTQILTGDDRSIIVGVIRDTGVNVIEIMKDVKRVAAELNAGPLPQAGLVMSQVHDDTIYINSAIGLVQQNIIAGGILAALVLLVFLRSFRATLVVTLVIPVSVIGSFVAMAALGRSINVISLAGIAFAVGMVVDAAIVVLENIYRHRQLGKSPFHAALHGAKQVWGAIFVSAMTTVMVFVPILVMNLEAGQLFRDIAVAISVAVLLSLIVSITVIPALSNRILTGNVGESGKGLPLPGVDWFGRTIARTVMSYARIVVGSKLLSVASVLLICGLAGAATWTFLPKLEYLPQGNRNLVLARVLTPPGYNLESVNRIATNTRARLEHLFAPPEQMNKVLAEAPSGISELWTRTVTWASSMFADETQNATEREPPTIARFWFIVRRGFTLAAAATMDPTRVAELMPILREAINQEPGSRGFVFQASLFGRGFGGGRNIDLDISGPDLDAILDVASRANQLAFQVFPPFAGNQIRPNPGLANANPEVRLVPDSQRLSDNGLTARDLGETIDAFNDGIRVAEVTVDGRRIDLVLAGPENNVVRTQGIDSLPVVTRSGQILPASSLADIRMTSSPEMIRHLERERTVSLEITPADNIPLEAAMDMVRDQIIAKLVTDGLPPGVGLTLGGTADALTETFDSMLFNLILAVVIVYLVMAILFESFVYPFIILFSVPLATAGGVAGLKVLNLYQFQALDMLTLLGFVILIGIVVNNAILLVHQTIVHVREDGMDVHAAVMEATGNRIRPIFMSTLTSVFGMLPLVLFPGAGSELYRGLGSVVIGGLTLSAILTLLIIPPLLGLVAVRVEGYRERRSAARRESRTVAAGQAAE
jgi:HAE1 family hydrophobic/amphiphilic exporter-1